MKTNYSTTFTNSDQVGTSAAGTVQFIKSLILLTKKVFMI